MSYFVKTFREFQQESSYRKLGECIGPILKGYTLTENFSNTETEESVEHLRTKFLAAIKKHPELIDEGFFSSIIGGVAGYVIGPRVGEVIARTLGIGKGILFDMFTSKLVGVALGKAIADYLGSNK